MTTSTQTRPLHDAYPKLATQLPHVAIADLPTPLRRIDAERFSLFVKQDDLTSPIYAGNKVRKLEYLLAQAVQHGCQRVATLGSAGSNHATATALHAHALGLGSISFLSRQHPTPWLAGNVIAQIDCGTRIVYVGGDRRRIRRTIHDTLQREHDSCWLIPMGGSSCTGTIGYVNAGFELAEQIGAGQMPQPDVIYLPLGTMGTAVGLCLGLRAAGVASPLVAVRVVHESVGSAARARRLYERTAHLLHRLDNSFPLLRFADARLEIRDDQFGAGYARPTDAAREALLHARTSLGLTLETTYSAKALAALLRDAERGDLDGRSVLYWNTFGGAAPSQLEAPDLRVLPDEIRTLMSDNAPSAR